jgi:glyoxylase-like metal-dependent hydrolase (beta-lactamase superfamily II)
MQEATDSAIGLAAAVGAANVSLPLQHGDRVPFGARHLEVRSTPGHTDGCLSFVLDDRSLAFTGDALLVRGCGRCDFQQGDAHTLWRSITEQLLSLPDTCLLYPGHDYIETNLKFTLSREPDNAAAQALLPSVTGHDPASSVVTTLAQEHAHNTFFRLDSASVMAGLRASVPDMPAHPDAETVFRTLRELRNKW